MRTHRPAKQKPNGFTLIELLIVMIIIGILAALSIATFQTSQKKARDTQRKNDLHQITNALEIYYNDYGVYPVSSGSNLILACQGGQPCNWGDQFVDDNDTTYMVQIPEDPSEDSRYVYVAPDGSYFQLYARLENIEDSAVPKNSSDEPQVYGSLNCGDAGCNYGISSANILPTTNHALVVE